MSDVSLIDHESFLAYGVATALFILGVVHLVGASDVIACFIAGSMINWDGWYQEECAGQAFSEIVDMYMATVSRGKGLGGPLLIISLSSCILEQSCPSIIGTLIQTSSMVGVSLFWEY